jgi:hypothetical protein
MSAPVLKAMPGKPVVRLFDAEYYWNRPVRRYSAGAIP